MSATVNKAPISKLPSKPSAMIRLALHDVAVLLKEKKAKINMDRWMIQRVARPGGKPRLCEVCFGGAVMMQTLKINPLVHGVPGSYDNTMQPTVMKCVPEMLSLEACDKIRALDYFRAGRVHSGLAQMSVSPRKLAAIHAGGLDQMSVPSFNRTSDFPAFRRAMQKMAGALERHGL
jgi:hypothetical protein